VRLLRPRRLVALATAALAVVGLAGAYSYWESYYQHRGFATVAFLPHAQRGQLQTVHFYSPALHDPTGAFRRGILHESGATFVIVPCAAPPALRRALAPVTSIAGRFGCVTVAQTR